MKKYLAVLVVCFLLVAAAPSFGAQLTGLIGAGAGRLTSVDSVAVAFNGYGGQQVVFIGLPIDYSSTVGFCGLASYSSMGSILAYGDTSLRRYMVLPADDFYVFLCLRQSGLSGSFAIAVGDYNSMIGAASTEVSEMNTRTASGSADDEMIDRLRKDLIKISEQISGR